MRLSATPRLLLMWASCLVLLSGAGCSYKSRNIMFKDKRIYAFYKQELKKGRAVISSLEMAQPKPDSAAVPAGPYRIKPGDRIAIQYINFPQSLLPSLSSYGDEAVAGKNGNTQQEQSVEPVSLFTVDEQGRMALPLIGRLGANGLTATDLRDTLEARYAQYVTSPAPLINVEVKSRYFTAFGFTTQQGKFQMMADRLTVYEALAEVNGPQFEAKLRQIQIVRGYKPNPEVLYIDLTNQQVLGDPRAYVYPGDILYVPPRDGALVRQSLSSITSFTALFTILNTLLLIPLRF